ncbi:MAG: hypothetical protein ACOZE5_18010 [Verrucomicrobiota bacterium]
MSPSNPFRLTWLLCLALVRGCYGLIVVAITILLAALAGLPLLAAAVAAYLWIWHGNRDWAFYTYIALFFLSGAYMKVWQAMTGIQGPPEKAAPSTGITGSIVSGMLGAVGTMAARSVQPPPNTLQSAPEPAPEKPRVHTYQSDGRLICTNGELRERYSGNFVGRVHADGRVTNGNGDYVGHVMSDGRIRK